MRVGSIFCLFVVAVAASSIVNKFEGICQDMGYKKTSEPSLIGLRGKLSTKEAVGKAVTQAPPKNAYTLKGTKVLKVGIAQYPPYTYEVDSQSEGDAESLIESTYPGWEGFSIDVFDKIVSLINQANTAAGLVEIDIQYVPATYAENLKKLNSGEIDTFATGVFLTRRLRQNQDGIKFSIGFWQSGMGIMVKSVAKDPSVFAALQSPGLWASIGGFFIGLIAFGLIWYFVEYEPEELAKGREGKEGSAFDRTCMYDTSNNITENEFLKGVGTGMWWTATTMTTVGYGDVFPKTNCGRVLSVFTMIASLFLVGMFTSNLTAAMTLNAIGGNNGINSIASLEGQNVAAVQGSFPYNYLFAQGKTNLQGTATMSAAVDKVLDGEVAAAVGVNDVLNYWSTQGKAAGNVKLVGSQYHAHSLVFPFTSGKEEVAKVFTDALLALEDTEAMDAIVNRYFKV